MAILKARKRSMGYRNTVVAIDALGDTYRLVADSWGNNYEYTCYVTLCMFYGVQYCSENIFDALIDLLDDKFFI